MSTNVPLPPELWTDERIREAFIYDGGEAEYHDPINGAQTQRQVAGSIFDAWLAAHDAALRVTLSASPANDVREALAAVYYCPEHGDLLPVDGTPDTRSVRCSHAHTSAQVRAMVRPRGTVTDTEVERVQNAAAERSRAFLQEWEVRAVLEAAQEGGPGASPVA